MEALQKAHKNKTSMHRRQIPLNALRSFEAVGQSLSFTRAAEALGVTHGAVSRQVTALEKVLGVRLLERGARLAFTRDGELLFKRIGPAFESLTSAISEVSRPDDRLVLRVNAPPTFTMKWLIPRLSVFHRRHPEIEVRLSTGIDLPKDDEAHAQDIIIRRLVRIDTFPSSKPFLSSALLPVCAPELLQGTTLRSAVDLAQFQLIEAATSGVKWADWFEKAGHPVPAHARINSLEQMFFAMQAALDGLGVALLPSALILDDLAAGRLTIPWHLNGIHERDYFYAVSPLSKEKRSAAQFVSWLSKEGLDANKLGKSVIEDARFGCKPERTAASG